VNEPRSGARQPTWRWPVALIVLIILFIPIRRYTLPSGLPVNLEVYRLVVGVVVALWFASLLVDPRIRLRRSGVDAPLLLFVAAILISLVANVHRVDAVHGDTLKAVSFFASFVLVFYLVVSVIQRRGEIDGLIKFLAGGGAVLAVPALVESASGFNLFAHLNTVLPFLHDQSAGNPLAAELFRGHGRRAVASAQHPIALGAAFCVLLPLAVYQAVGCGRRRWWAAAGLLALGILASGSRTPVIMLGAQVVVYVALRAREARRLWPALVPALLAAYIATPGTIGALKDSFFPHGGLVAQQKYASVGSGRLATLGPVLRHEFKPHPLVGEGFGTRIVTPDPLVPVPNAPILDDEWLGVLVETGILGALALAWFFLRSVRWLGREAKRDRSPRGWLLAGITASITAYAVGMFLYDAFSFIQVTFLFMIVLALGASAALSPAEEWQPEALLHRRRDLTATIGFAHARGQLA
jgi:hypothetical protein